MSSAAPGGHPVPGGSWSLYPYVTPNRAAASIFYVLFGLSSGLHLVQILRFGIARYSMLLPWAALIYTAGFIMRFVSSFHIQNLGIFISAVVLIYTSPPVYAAVNYLILGRLLHYVPSKSPIHPGRVVSSFIALDLIVELLTAQGAWLVVDFKRPSNVKIGLVLVRISLCMQLALYLGFLVLQVVVYRRCRRDGVKTRVFYRTMRIMFIANGLILFRSIYRTVDSFLGFGGYLDTHEWTLYFFDALPMLANTWMLNIVHPSIFLPASSRIYLSSDGLTERLGPGWTDKRNFLVSSLDPFDVGGMITGRNSTTRFWEDQEKHPIVASDPNKLAGYRRPFWVTLNDPFHWIGIERMYVEGQAQRETIKDLADPIHRGRPSPPRTSR